MSFLSMDLLGPHSEMENLNQYMLTVICMLTNYVFMVPIKAKTTEDVIPAYLKHVYSTFGGSKCILNDRGSKFTRKQFTWLAKELGFTKVYISPYILTAYSVIERTHFDLKVSSRKMTSNHNNDYNSIAHIAEMVYNVFLQSSSGETPFYLMFGQDA